MVPFPTEVCSQEANHHCRGAADWRCLKLHTSDEIIPVIDAIVAALGTAGYSGKEAFGVRLALEEALVNAIKHGHKGDTAKAVRLRYHLTAECILAEIADEGPGFKPEEVPDPFAPENCERPCGRGLLLIKNYMTWVRYNAAGNCVTMCRHRLGA